MTISATFALQNVPINADTVRQAIASLLPNGAGGIVQHGDYAVTQTTTASMAVNVGVGRAWIEGTDAGHLSGQGYGKQGKYFVLNDAAYPVTISTSDPTNPRIDVVYVAIQDATYAGANNQAVIAVATGVPAAGATYPANAPTLPTNALALAWINVPAGAASIITANITTLATVPSVVPATTLQALSTADATWAYNCMLFASAAVTGEKYVSFQFIVARTGGSAFNCPAGSWTTILTGLIPAGYRPTDYVTTTGTIEFNGLSSALVRVGTDGSIALAGVTGPVSAGSPSKFCASFVWKIA